VTLDLHVIKASVNETDVAGECVSTIIIAGTNAAKAHELLACVGEEINIRTAGSSRKLRAVLNSVTVKGKDGKVEFRAKAAGGRDLDSIVGLAVDVEAAQMRIGSQAAEVAVTARGHSPEAEAALAETDRKLKAGEICNNPRCMHGLNTRPKGKKKDGHTEGGSCFCGCKEFGK
jgi:ribosomal protein L12E/L44/L45/RPP1/RPP2